MTYTSETDILPKEFHSSDSADIPGVRNTVGNLLSSFADRCRYALRATQLARMNSVLLSMPDHILDEIGVNRAEIPDYARSLLYEPDTSDQRNPGGAASSKPRKSQEAD